MLSKTSLRIRIPVTALAGGSVMALCLCLAPDSPRPVVEAQQPRSAYATRPLYFEESPGQTAADPRFVARGQGYGLFLRSDDAVLMFRDGSRTPAAVRLRLHGAAPAAITGEDRLAATANYFRGGAATRTHVPLFGRVRYREVYPGIDLVYYGNQGQLEYDFVVAPGSDPDRIRLSFEGAEPPVVTADGALHVALGDREIIQHPPTVYQVRGGQRETVAARYRVDAQAAVGIEVAAYDPALPLVIDPVLVYSTFLGGNSEDWPQAIAVDDEGNAYVAGRTLSLDFPATPGAPDTSGNGSLDAFVAKFDPSGSQLLYATYLGGEGHDEAHAIVADADGNAYVAGRGYGFATPGAYGENSGGAFVAKLSPDGSTLLYSAFVQEAYQAYALALAADGSTYIAGEAPGDNEYSDAYVARLSSDGSQLSYFKRLGGSSFDTAVALAVDAGGNAYVAGRTYDGDIDFPTTPGAFSTTYNGSAHDSNCCDGFVLKLDPDGQNLLYSTFLGGSDYDFPHALVIDAEGYAYVGGQTGSATGVGDFPTTTGAFQPEWGGYLDGFVAKLDPTGSALVFSTYFSAVTATRNSYEDVAGLALDPAGRIYVTGTADSGGLGSVLTLGAFDTIFNGGGTDAFLALLDRDGSRIVYATLFGGSAYDRATGLAVNPEGIYLTGVTAYGMEIDHSDLRPFPTTLGAYDNFHNGNQNDGSSYGWDAFVVRVRPLVDSVAELVEDVLSVAADATSVVVDVVREGDLNGTFQVDYTAVSDTSEGEVVVASGTLEWATGDDEPLTVEIPIAPGSAGSAAAKSATTGSPDRIYLSQPNGRLGSKHQAEIVRAEPAPAAAAAGGGGTFNLFVLLYAACGALIRRRRFAPLAGAPRTLE